MSFADKKQEDVNSWCVFFVDGDYEVKDNNEQFETQEDAFMKVCSYVAERISSDYEPDFFQAVKYGVVLKDGVKKKDSILTELMSDVGSVDVKTQIVDWYFNYRVCVEYANSYYLISSREPVKHLATDFVDQLLFNLDKEGEHRESFERWIAESTEDLNFHAQHDECALSVATLRSGVPVRKTDIEMIAQNLDSDKYDHNYIAIVQLRTQFKMAV